jgi:lipopolysaccharide/colanic/teichoic acid biosynthesis glycosyltransferase
MYRLWHTARLEVKPGLTGLWQVSGRADVDFDDRLRLDIAYIRNRGLWLDLRILFRTIGAVASRKGAH